MKFILLGPIIANGLIGLSGGLLSHYQYFADINMGFGILINGLAFMFIGSSIISSNKISIILISSIVGVFIYECFIYFSLKYQLLRPEDFKLITALFVVTFIVFQRITKSEGYDLDII